MLGKRGKFSVGHRIKEEKQEKRELGKGQNRKTMNEENLEEQGWGSTAQACFHKFKLMDSRCILGSVSHPSPLITRGKSDFFYSRYGAFTCQDLVTSFPFDSQVYLSI